MSLGKLESEHPRTGSALSETERDAFGFFERAPLGLIWASPEGRVQHANGLWRDGRLMCSRWSVRDITDCIGLEREILDISDTAKPR